MHLQVTWAIRLFTLFSFAFSQCKSETITVLTIVGASHSRDAEMISEALSRNGHQVSLVRSSERTVDIDPSVKVMSYDGEKVPESESHAAILKMMGDFSLNDLGVMHRFHARICDLVLQDESIMSQIKRSDLIMADYLFQCHLFLGDYLDIPVVSFYAWSIRSIMTNCLGIPSHISYTPIVGSGLPQEMSFTQRLQNAFISTILGVYRSVVLKNKIWGSLLEKHNISTNHLNALPALSIVLMEFTVEYPLPTVPDVVYVGPISTRPAKSLTSEIKDFFEQAGDQGVLYVSFGTYVEDFDPVLLSRLAAAFGRLQQNVIWKLRNTSHLTIPTNVKVVEWAPQNDILGHPKTVGFLSHGGVRSLYESVYHGVPILIAPTHMDTFDNARIATDRLKMGLSVEIFEASVEKWSSLIKQLVGNQSYKISAMKASKRLRSQKHMGLEAVVDWVTYTLENGGKLPHLQMPSRSFSWYKYYSIDVFGFCLICLMLSVIIISYITKCLITCLKGIFKKRKID